MVILGVGEMHKGDNEDKIKKMKVNLGGSRRDDVHNARREDRIWKLLPSLWE